MAPFAFLTHHSFRRGASSPLTAVPESGAQLSSDMGATPSRVGPNASETSHKKIRPRSSSLNLLKRSRTPSGNAAVRVSLPPQSSVDTTILRGDDTEIECTENVTDFDPDTTIRIPSYSTSSSKSKGDDIDCDSLSDASSTRTATRVTPPSLGKRDLPDHERDGEASGAITPVPPPPPPRTPQILLPEPHVLPEDSPTKYGLRSAMTPSPERSLTAAQRKKMTGAGLFVHAANQQKTSLIPADQAKSGAPDPNHKFSHSSPALALPATPSPGHTNSLPNRKMRNRQNPFKDAPLDHVAHALPLKRSQRTCFRGHDAWRRMGRNLQHPVSCTICDGYDAPGDDFMVCVWCEMHVCGHCYSTFTQSGTAMMMGKPRH